MKIATKTTYHVTGDNFAISFSDAPGLTHDQVIEKIIGDFPVTLNLDTDPDYVITTAQAKDAETAYTTLPDWVRKVTAEDAAKYVDDRVFGGLAVVDVEKWIDEKVNTLAEAKNAMKVMAGAVVNLRDLLKIIIKLLFVIRNIVIKRIV